MAFRGCPLQFIATLTLPCVLLPCWFSPATAIASSHLPGNVPFTFTLVYPLKSTILKGTSFWRALLDSSFYTEPLKSKTQGSTPLGVWAGFHVAFCGRGAGLAVPVSEAGAPAPALGGLTGRRPWAAPEAREPEATDWAIPNGGFRVRSVHS